MDDAGNPTDEPSAASSADEAAQPGVQDELASRVAAVSARAEELAARVAEFSAEARATLDPEPEPSPGRLRRWLFARRPPRVVEATGSAAEPPPEQTPEATPKPVRLQPAPISLALDAADAATSDIAPPVSPGEAAEDTLAGQGQQPPAEPETEVAETEVAETEVAETEVAETEVAETEGGEAEPGEAEAADAEGDSEAEELKARPRPWSGAPVVYEKPAVSLSKGSPGPARADPIADFFARKDDDERRRWFGRKTAKATTAKPAAAKSDPAKSDETKSGKSTAKASEKRDSPPWPKAVRRTVRFVIAVGIAVVAALLLRSYVVQPYYVPSQSMEPTLHGCPGCNDDHVLVEKLSYRFHDVQAGDIVVFHRPSSWPAGQVPDDVLIKRVIGVAGDRLTLKHGRVFRNGQPLEESYVNQKCRRGTTDKTGSVHKKTYPRVPNGEVFVMGDNRCDSEDSRFFGDVPTSDVIGRAFLIIWPVGRIHSLN